MGNSPSLPMGPRNNFPAKHWLGQESQQCSFAKCGSFFSLALAALRGRGTQGWSDKWIERVNGPGSEPHTSMPQELFARSLCRRHLN